MVALEGCWEWVGFAWAETGQRVFWAVGAACTKAWMQAMKQGARSK